MEVKKYPVYLTAKQIDDLYGLLSAQQFEIEKAIDIAEKDYEQPVSKDYILKLENDWKSLNLLMKIMHEKTIEIDKD